MFITLCYCVIDREREALHFANAGHPHAFVITASGAAERLPAMSPPLGMIDQAPAGSSRAWQPGEDLLLLFTDGVSDAQNADGIRLGEQAVLDAVCVHRSLPVTQIVDRVFDMLELHTGATPLRDDLTLLVLRS
jgi:sigma-B regulation protein RsbU (phosphoserine phosphatase)